MTRPDPCESLRRAWTPAKSEIDCRNRIHSRLPKCGRQNSGRRSAVRLAGSIFGESSRRMDWAAAAYRRHQARNNVCQENFAPGSRSWRTRLITTKLRARRNRNVSSFLHDLGGRWRSAKENLRRIFFRVLGDLFHVLGNSAKILHGFFDFPLLTGNQAIEALQRLTQLSAGLGEIAGSRIETLGQAVHTLGGLRQIH